MTTQQRRVRVRPYPETHQHGSISIEYPLPQGLVEGDLGILVASDGRVWVCVDGVALLRFKPSTVYIKEE